jgi:hypothetical protein
MRKYLLAILVGTLSAPAFAADNNASADLDVHLSTLGYGLGIAFPMTDSIAGRVGFNQFNKNIDKTSGQVNYTGDLKLSSFDVLADWHPFNGVSHLTAGLMYNNNKFALTAVPSGGNITINGHTYPSSVVGTMTAAVDFNKVAPYLGFGWSGQAKNTGFSFKSDFGILFQGKPKSTVICSNPTNDPTLAADCNVAQTTLSDDLKNYRYYPVISLGIGYAF